MNDERESFKEWASREISMKTGSGYVELTEKLWEEAQELLKDIFAELGRINDRVAVLSYRPQSELMKERDRYRDALEKIDNEGCITSKEIARKALEQIE